MKLLALSALLLAVVDAQTVLVCGIQKGCVLAGLGPGIVYDPTANKLSAAQPKPILVDTFRVNCAQGVGCLNGIPQTVFRTSHPVGSFILAFRAIAQSDGPESDYAHTVNPDNTWTLTFAVPADTGNVVLVYQ